MNNHEQVSAKEHLITVSLPCLCFPLQRSYISPVGSTSRMSQLVRAALRHGPSFISSNCVHNACAWQATSYLLRAHASTLAQNKDGETPLHLAAKRGALSSLHALVSYMGKDSRNPKNKDGKTPVRMPTHIIPSFTDRREGKHGTQGVSHLAPLPLPMKVMWIFLGLTFALSMVRWILRRPAM